MNAHSMVRLLGPAVLAAWGLSISVPAIPSAAADGCPDSEVVFARGTGEPEGVGPTGQAFVDAVTARLPGKSVGVYPVNYPATQE